MEKKSLAASSVYTHQTHQFAPELFEGRWASKSQRQPWKQNRPKTKTINQKSKQKVYEHDK
jgi:hypothetical protein